MEEGADSAADRDSFPASLSCTDFKYEIKSGWGCTFLHVDSASVAVMTDGIALNGSLEHK